MAVLIKYLKPLLIKSHQANTYIVYWYFSGKGVATDNSGALTQPTFAVLNDRGSGNAPGGGVQEVIHRADGTFHAPQGRDVVVPLGVGDSVINANDTLKLQRMGVLPKFHGGTKRKIG